MAIVAVMIMATVGATSASAAARCGARDQAQLLGAMRTVAALRAANAPGVADARSVLGRARTRCTTSAFARAVAVATQRRGVPTIGRRTRFFGVDLIGTPAGTQVVWRLDVATTARRTALAKRPGARAAARSQLLAATHAARNSVTFSADPTKTTWDASGQSSVVAILRRSPETSDRVLAQAGVRAFGVAARRNRLTTMPLLDHLLIADRLAIVAAKGDTRTRASALLVARGAVARSRRARSGSWTKLAGTWSTAAQHRTLVTRTAVLRTVDTSAPTRNLVTALRATLKAPPMVEFRRLPGAAFYPWPRDGAFDTQSIAVSVDKPSTVQLLVYDAVGTLLRTVETAAVPGDVDLVWDGNQTDGQTVGAGEYRYVVGARDPLGNRVDAPGLQTFVVARDTAPPVVSSATVTYTASGTLGPRIIAGWSVTEPLSPNVRTVLKLTSGTKVRTLVLSTTERAATMRRSVALPAGTWHGTFSFTDGSGNVATAAAGKFSVR